jgi:hypothetical protein
MAVHGAGTVGKSIANACINADRLSTTMRSQNIGIEIDDHSGHYYQPGWNALEIGREAFKARGITFP